MGHPLAQVRGVYGHGESFAEAVADWQLAAEMHRETSGSLESIDEPDPTPDAVETTLISA